MAKTIFAALDVGTTKTCGIIASTGDAGAFRVLGVGVSATRGLKKGVVINLDEARDSIREAVKKAEHASGMKMESAYVGVTGKHISSLNTRSAVAVGQGDRLVKGGDMKRVLESAREIEIPSDRRLLHVITPSISLTAMRG